MLGRAAEQVNPTGGRAIRAGKIRTPLGAGAGPGAGMERG